MTGGSIDVLAPGLLTTVQDLGRWGHQAEGVPVAGAMDPFAHRLANLLVGNAREAATLEVTFTGPRLQFSDARRIAVAGAEFVVTLDGIPVEPETMVLAERGSILQFGARLRGARSYLAIEGGVDVPLVLGSRATHVPTGMGGLDGRALARGDRLPLGRLSGRAALPMRSARGAASSSLASASAAQRSHSAHPTRIRVLPGPQQDRFAADALDSLTSAAYTIATDANRMGYRLAGPALAHRRGADIIPDATPLGSLQVPAEGQPVLLMADRQTSGGYAKLATVISADIPVVAQAAPGDRIAFAVCSRADAVRALIERERRLLSIDPS